MFREVSFYVTGWDLLKIQEGTIYPLLFPQRECGLQPDLSWVSNWLWRCNVYDPHLHWHTCCNLALWWSWVVSTSPRQHGDRPVLYSCEISGTFLALSLDLESQSAFEDKPVWHPCSFWVEKRADPITMRSLWFFTSRWIPAKELVHVIRPCISPIALPCRA